MVAIADKDKAHGEAILRILGREQRMADGQKRIAIRPAEREHAEAIGELLLGVVVETGEKLHLLGTGAMADGIVEDEHVDAIRLSQGSEQWMSLMLFYLPRR